MTAKIEYLHRPPAGWHALDVMQEKTRSPRWVALLIDMHPDDLKACACEFPALFYVHPKEYRPGSRKAQQRWLRIPGKHKNKDAAWDALQALLETRH
jgi:hypothetical protein